MLKLEFLYQDKITIKKRNIDFYDRIKVSNDDRIRVSNDWIKVSNEQMVDATLFGFRRNIIRI